MATSPPLAPWSSTLKPPARAVTVSSIEGLSQIRDSRFDLAIWARDLPPWVYGACADFADRTPGFRTHCELVAARRSSFDALLSGVPEGPLRSFLRRDITYLAACFGALVERKHVHGTLQVVTGNMCRKLHADNMPLRLLCTYAGPCTQWVDWADVRPEHLARGDISIDQANDLVLDRDWTKLRHAACGDVLVLKGYDWRGERPAAAIPSAAVHRSPEVEERGLRRLLLKLDVYPCGC
ncbi:MAG: DUF1826 domain-containing protein [Sandaracinaceae bacterium]